LHWSEIQFQVHLDVLKAKDVDGNRLYYNGMIAGIKFIPKDEYPEIAISQTGSNNTIFKAIANGNHPTLGKGHTDVSRKKMSESQKKFYAAVSTEEKDERRKAYVGVSAGTKNRSFKPWAYKEPDKDWVEMHDTTIKDWYTSNRHKKIKVKSFTKPKKKSYWSGWDFKILEVK